MSTSGPRVAVVTGGAAGIGAAIAEELGRQGLFVVTVDPGLAIDGSLQGDGAEESTARRIVDAGGRARASNVSVTDEAAVGTLLADLASEFGALDVVVNVAGFNRNTGFATGLEADWREVLAVHLDGYLNVLRAALPIMAAAGHGQILGVTSGSGWRPSDAGAYGCAKRAVAALTWQLGVVAPAGVIVNALSPIAATRMVTASRARRAASSDDGAADKQASGGIDLATALPPPEHLGPVGVYLSSETFSWCSGEVIFSNGSEVSLISSPHLLEAIPTTDLASLPARLDALGPALLAQAEATQATNGGSGPRGMAFTDGTRSARPRRCVIVTDSAPWADVMTAAFARRGVECVPVTPDRRFAAAAEHIAQVGRDVGPVDAVVVALAGGSSSDAPTSGVAPWQRVLDEHSGITEQIRTDAAWMRGVADCAESSGRPMRVVTVVDATSAGGRSRGQAAAQLARGAHLATSDRVDAFSISVEAAPEAAAAPVAEIAASLACADGTGALSGAELVAGAGWFGLRRHPSPAATVSFDGPAVPDWLDTTVRAMVAGHRAAPSPHRPA